MNRVDKWTILADYRHRLQSFHVSCQCQILGVKWQDHVKNVNIADMTTDQPVEHCGYYQQEVPALMSLE